MTQTRAEAAYIQHPLSVPPRLCVAAGRDAVHMDLVAHGRGGVRLHTPLGYAPGTRLEVRVAACDCLHRFRGLVLWRRALASGGYELGLGFATDAAAFEARMIEQLCYIEDYRQRRAAAGVTLSAEQAAREWVQRFSGSFPHIGGLDSAVTARGGGSVRRCQPQPGVAIA